MSFRYWFPNLLLAFGCVTFAARPALAGDKGWEDWKPIDPAHLSLKAPVVEKDADAEVIFWEVQVDASSDRKVFMNYIRIKIFTERGRESQSKIDLPYE